MRLKGTEQNILGGKLRRGVTTRMIDAAPSDVYEIRPRRKGDGIDLIGDQLRQGPIWYAGPDAVRRRLPTRSIAPGRARAGRLSACWTTPES